METKRILKDDGRYLIFYTFTHEAQEHSDNSLPQADNQAPNHASGAEKPEQS